MGNAQWKQQIGEKSDRIAVGCVSRGKSCTAKQGPVPQRKAAELQVLIYEAVPEVLHIDGVCNQRVLGPHIGYDGRPGQVGEKCIKGQKGFSLDENRQEKYDRQTEEEYDRQYPMRPGGVASLHGLASYSPDSGYHRISA